MVNADCPTNQSHQINIQYFAIQDWKKAGHLFLQKIQCIINPRNCLTKDVGWVLHSHHALGE
jgi:hypothetical protein